MERRILSQGDMDGACFLYSTANSYLALTRRYFTKTTQQSFASEFSDKWKEAIQSLCFRTDCFLDGSGTADLDGNWRYLEGFCSDFLELLGMKKERFAVINEKAKLKKDLRSLIGEERVVIAPVNNGEHWVCIVDSDESNFFVACSSAYIEEDEYEEKRTPNHMRVWNLKLSYRNLRLQSEKKVLVIQFHGNK